MGDVVGQRSIRSPEELEKRLVALAELERRSFSSLVVLTLEEALGPASWGDSGGAATGGGTNPSAPPRAPVPPMQRARDLLGRDSAAMERQRKMNEAKGL